MHSESLNDDDDDFNIERIEEIKKVLHFLTKKSIGMQKDGVLGSFGILRARLG
jgi:hypothetical protein